MISRYYPQCFDILLCMVMRIILTLPIRSAARHASLA